MTSRQERVMVVEDDQVVNALVCELLSRSGYATTGVYDGSEAITRVQDELPDAVILDVMLPGASGFEVCRALKFQRRTNAIPILMLTALDGRESRWQGLRVGANRYLTKPFDPDVFLSELNTVLSARNESSQRNTRIEFEMTSDDRRIEQLNGLLTELFVHTNLPEEDLDLVRQAVLEMIENAREWGNRRRADLLVNVAYELTDDELKFIITDQGSGFNPNSVPHAARDDDPMSHIDVRNSLGLRCGGFGMLLTRGIMDEVSYNDKGNQVTLVKRLKKDQPSQ